MCSNRSTFGAVLEGLRLPSVAYRVNCQRLANLARCARTIQEVDSDLERVEAQIDLVLENASLHGGSDVLPGTIELASQLLVGDFDFGESEEVVSALDRVYRARPPVRNAQSS